jgi:hypothetical protein
MNVNDRFHVIDEVSFNELGMFPSREAALDFVAALLTVNTDDFLDELSISGDGDSPLTGDALRDALDQRTATRERVAAPAEGETPRPR